MKNSNLLIKSFDFGILPENTGKYSKLLIRRSKLIYVKKFLIQ